MLVDYHNGLLDLLEKELNSDGNSNVRALKNLVNNLTSKDVSILQIARDSTGVITLNDRDMRWIEKLARSSLMNDEEGYRHTAETPFQFDLVHVQSYIIRTHLLLCRINYRHIAQKYQCRVRTTRTAATNEAVELDKNYLDRLSRQQLESDWNHLKQMPLGALQQGTHLLRQIALMLKSNDKDQSQMSLSHFIRAVANDDHLLQQLDQYEIKDFPLCYIDHVRELYEDSISDFQYLFTDVPQLLQTPLDRELDAKLSNMLHSTFIDVDYGDDVDRIKATIQTITDLLNDLRAIEDTLALQSTRSLTETCQHVCIVNPILTLIPVDLKGEHYVPLSIHLIRARAILQERAVNIEEKETKLWQANFNQKANELKEGNRYHSYLNATEDTSIPEESERYLDADDWEPSPMASGEDQSTNNLSFLSDDDVNDDDATDLERSATTTTTAHPIPADRQPIDYSALFEFDVKRIPLNSSTLFDQIHQARRNPATQSEVIAKAQKFVVTYPDGKSQSYLLKSESLFEQLRKIFRDKKYNLDAQAVVDKDEIFVDFTNDATRRTLDVSLEYSIIDRTNLFRVQLSSHEQSFECFATSKALIRHIIDRFIEQRNEQEVPPSKCLCFFNSYGRTIDDVTIGELCKTTPHEEKTITIAVSEEDIEKNLLCEITLRPKQGKESTAPSRPPNLFSSGEELVVVFHRTTQWQQIDAWLQSCVPIIVNPSAHGYAYFVREQNGIVPETELISLGLDEHKSLTVDAIDRCDTTRVRFSYETNSQLIYALKSMRIHHLFFSERLLQQLNLVDISPTDCVLVVGDNKDQILSQEDMQNPVNNYLTPDDQPIHFRVSLLIQISTCTKHQYQQIPLSNARITIADLLALIQKPSDEYKYIASNTTKRVLASTEQLFALRETKFFLVRASETCLVNIDTSRDAPLIALNDEPTEIEQTYMLSSTVGDIYRENQIDAQHRHLLFSNDFIPSPEASVMSLATVPPIRCTLMDGNLPITITIENPENGQSIDFRCSLSIPVKRLRFIACQLFDSNETYYQLMLNECIVDNDDLSLDDIIQTAAVEARFQLISKASMKSSIVCEGQTVLLACNDETLAAELVEATLRKLHVPKDDAHLYDLVALTDDRIQINLGTSIEDIRELFPPSSSVILFELNKIS